MIADLTHWWHWPPDAAWGMTGTRLIWWLDQTNRIVRERQAAEE